MPLRVAFVHPDLGIGGAERLVVDAALALQAAGHDVAFFTSHHDPKRCFEETRNGTLKVHAYPPPIPRSFKGKFHIICAILRQLHLLGCMLLALMAGIGFGFGEAWKYDVFFVDSLSTCIPILRALTGKRVVFYCHFPDKVLSMGTYEEGGHRKESLIKRLYRAPVDLLEEFTTGDADVILANSKFTASVVARHLPSISHRTRVVYPGINIDSYKPLLNQEQEAVYSDRPTFLSLNRFEPKKNVVLAVKAFARLQELNASLFSGGKRPRLVLGGGYDSRLKDNIRTISLLEQTFADLSLTYAIHHPESPSQTGNAPADTADVLVILNFTMSERSALLNAPSTLALLYTPMNEHFGIGPVEAMVCGLPVLACNSGGPTETVVDIGSVSSSTSNSSIGEVGTGWLRPPKQDEWALVMHQIITMPEGEKKKLGKRAKEWGRKHFALESLGRGVERAVVEAGNLGPVRWGYGLLVASWMVMGMVVVQVLWKLGVLRG